MIRVRILVGCLVNGVPLQPGALVQVSASDAQVLISMGRAAAAEAPEPEVATQPPAKKAVRRTRKKRTTKKA